MSVLQTGAFLYIGDSIMIMTYDFVLMARRDPYLKEEILSAMKSDSTVDVLTDIHRLHFQPDRQTVIVRALSDTSDFHWKISPKEITYRAVSLMLDGKWDALTEEDIQDVEE